MTMSTTLSAKQQKDQELLFAKAKVAREEDRCVSYIASDGCEITITPKGHVFYNVADWW